MKRNILKLGVSIVLGLYASTSLVYADDGGLTYSDVAGKRYYSEYDVSGVTLPVRISFYSNMNFKTEVKYIFYWEDAPDGEGRGEWALENGFMTSESIVVANVNKATGILIPNFDLNTVLAIKSGRGQISESTAPLTGVDNVSGDIIPAYDVTVNEIQGKKLTIGTKIWYFLNNMNCIVIDDSATVFMGTWKIEKGVLVVDGGWEERDANDVITGVRSQTFSILFSAAPAAGTTMKTYSNANLDSTVNLDAISAIPEEDTLPVPFNNDPITYAVSVSQFAGEQIIIEYNGGIQSRLTFNANMTYKREDDLALENPVINTGIWSVEEGVIILDEVHNDNHVAQLALRFPQEPKTGVTFKFININVSDLANEGDGKGIFASEGEATIFNPSEDPVASPAIIMYLLN